MKGSCLVTLAQWDVIQAEAMTSQSTQEFVPQDLFVFYGNQMMTEIYMRQSLRSSLEKSQSKPQNRVSDRLSQLVTRFRLPRLRYCLCMPSPPQVGNESQLLLFDIFKTVFQQVCHIKVDVIAGDANAAAHKYYKSQEYQDMYDSSVAVMLREMQREGQKGTPI